MKQRPDVVAAELERDLGSVEEAAVVRVRDEPLGFPVEPDV